MNLLGVDNIYIIIALLIFGILILVHELGHYLFARVFKVDINEFSIGMGPKIFARTSKKTNILYSLRILPIGGYVSMKGEDEESQEEGALCNKPVWQRLIIVAAGSFMNILLGFVLVFCMVLATQNLGSTTIHSFHDNAVSQEFGLAPMDKVIAVDSVKVHTASSLSYEIAHAGADEVDLTVERNGERTIIENVKFGTQTEEGTTFGLIDFYVYAEAKNPLNVIKHTFYDSLLNIKMIWQSLFDFVTGKYGMDALSGPVGVTSTIADATKNGLHSILYLASIIAMNLGVFNMLPIPALDGGRVFFMLVELVRGKPINREYEAMVHFIGIVALMSLMVIITYKDIIKLLG